MAATRKVADHTLYHLNPKGFWKKFRDVVVVNPEISSGLPIASLNRWPPPGSRPERYATPATKASDPAQNPYWKRDVRRAYPRLSVVTQDGMAELLYVKSPEGQAALAAPAAEGEVASSVPVVATSRELSSVLGRVNVQFTDGLPPALPTSFKRWKPEAAPDAPHDPHSYFPMALIR